MRIVKNWMVVVLMGTIGLCPKSGWAASRTSLAFENSWISQTADFNKYKEVFIDSVDLRGMVLQVWDEDTQEYDRKFLKADILEAVGQRMYSAFAENIRLVMTVNDGEMGKTDIPGLVIKMRLKAEIHTQEDRFLMNTVNRALGKAGEPFTLMFECEITDQNSGEKLITVSDAAQFTSESASAPFSSAEDLDQLTAVFNTWALRLADLIGKYRTQPGS